MTELHTKQTGLDRVTAGLGKFPDQIARYMGAAGQEAADEILDTRGLRRYPPATRAILPPAPYYIRGRGRQGKSRNDGRSERLGTQFYVKTQGYTTEIGNRARYAQHVVGEQQARAMGRIGWRKLPDAALEKLPQITKIFQGWIDKLLGDLGL